MTLNLVRRDLARYTSGSRSRLSEFWIALTTLGFHVMFLHRVSVLLLRGGLFGRAVSRLIDLVMHVISGCFISRRANIDGGLFLPHATGIVIGQGVTVGSSVTIFQHVTLGSARTGENSYPRVGNNVIIFANAVVIGNISVGENSIIAAGAVVMKDVPANGRAAGNPAKVWTPEDRTSE